MGFYPMTCEKCGGDGHDEWGDRCRVCVGHGYTQHLPGTNVPDSDVEAPEDLRE
jgi:DnaJ-class molecular chaperone